MRSDYVWLSDASRHASKVIYDLVRRQQACPLKPSGCVFFFSFRRFRTHRINTAGQLPKEAVSINRDMVRTHTFDLADFEQILARPVCSLAVSCPRSADPPASQGPAPSKRRRSGCLACDAAAIWSLRSFASARRELRILSD